MTATQSPSTQNFQRIPPQNTDAEKAVLGACLLNAEAIYSAMEYVRPADFYRQEHRVIFQCMMDLNSQAIPCDLVTVTEGLKKTAQLDMVGGMSYLAQLTNEVPSAAAAAQYSRIVADKSLQRALIEAAQNVVDTGYGGGKDGMELLGDAENVILGIGERKLKQNFRRVSLVMSQEFDRIDEIKSADGVTGVPTFRDLDRYLSGLQKGDLIILAARPSMGKTSMAMNIAANAAVQHGLSAAVFSLEMPVEQLAQRILCSHARVDQSRWRSGRLSEVDIDKLSNSLGDFGNAKLFIDDSPNITVAEIRAKSRRLQSEVGLNLVVVDYLQLIRSGYRVENRQQEIAEISRSLKGLAKELNIPVLALSQLSRQAEQGSDRSPMLSHLRESGALEQDADVVLFIHRPRLEDEEETTPLGQVEVIIAKNRNGPVGEEKLGFLRHYTLFTDLVEKFPPAGQ